MASPLLLEGEVFRDDTPRLRREIDNLVSELRTERQKTSRIESGVRELRHVLDPLRRALMKIYDEIDQMEVSGSSVPELDARKKQAWDNWKQQLGGLPGRFIDALLLHGAMTQTQLRIAVGCAQGSVAGAVCALNKAGLINKANGKISLKEL